MVGEISPYFKINQIKLKIWFIGKKEKERKRKYTLAAAGFEIKRFHHITSYYKDVGTKRKTSVTTIIELLLKY